MFELIGQIVVGLVLLAPIILLCEILRDYIVAIRVTWLRFRIYYGKRAKWDKRKFFRAWLKEPWKSYSYSVINGIRIHPNGSWKRDYYFGDIYNR